MKALYKTGLENDIELKVVRAAEERNDEQKLVLFHKLKTIYPDLKGKTIALWGLSFKPETDDMRDAPSLYILEALSKEGCTIKAYDPIAIEETKRRLPNIKVEYCNDPYEALENANALLLLTEWKEFRLPSWKRAKELMKDLVLLDGRNIYDGKEMRELGFYYEGIGTR